MRSLAVLAALGWLAVAMPPARAQAAPVLVSVTPANGATGVGAAAPLVFVFDQAMDVTVLLRPSVGGFAGNFEIIPSNLAPLFTGSWGEDRRTLTLQPFFAVPPGQTITWTLNPPGTIAPLKSQAGVALATVSGSYSTGGGPGAPATFYGFRLNPGGNPVLELGGTAGRPYGIQRAASVSSATWPEIGTVTMDAGGRAVFEDAEAGKVFPLFYRAVAK